MIITDELPGEFTEKVLVNIPEQILENFLDESVKKFRLSLQKYLSNPQQNFQ